MRDLLSYTCFTTANTESVGRDITQSQCPPGTVTHTHTQSAEMQTRGLDALWLGSCTILKDEDSVPSTHVEHSQLNITLTPEDLVPFSDL